MGGCISVGSLIGVGGARSKNRIILFVFFLWTLLLIATLLLAVIYSFVESDYIGGFLSDNWEELQLVLGVEISLEHATELAHDYFVVIASVGILAIIILLTALVSTIRLLGLRAIAYSIFLTLAILGGVSIYLASISRDQIPTVTTWLLIASGAVQIVASVCGACGFRNQNRECLHWLFVVLVISCGGLVYVVVSTYMWIRDSEVKAENILLVFGISLATLFFLGSTLLVSAIFYCTRRRMLKQADQAKQLPVHYSDYKSRARGSQRRPGSCREYSARSAL